ncbi:MAG: DoxX family protein [Gemmatimonadales bacterium]|nr:DoxX family protein [Gemmatimonadales bacterium]
MSFFAPTSISQLNAALLLVRITTGTVFLAHGVQKLFQFGIDGVVNSFEQMGIVVPAVVGPAVSVIEFFGGLALLLGLLTRPAAFALLMVMFGAAVSVHIPNGFFLPNGYEFVLALGGINALLVLTGGGAHSLDAMIAARRGAPTS